MDLETVRRDFGKGNRLPLRIEVEGGLVYLGLCLDEVGDLEASLRVWQESGQYVLCDGGFVKSAARGGAWDCPENLADLSPVGKDVRVWSEDGEVRFGFSAGSAGGVFADIVRLIVGYVSLLCAVREAVRA